MLANKVDPPAAVNLAKGLTDALEDPQKEDYLELGQLCLEAHVFWTAS